MRAEMSKTPSRGPSSQLYLPAGFRFCPTDEELVVHYLCTKAASQPFSVPIIGEVELYKFDPWDLPEKALFGEKEWYFFSPRDRKYPNGSRPNRAAGCGFWKATGTDKPISSFGGSKKVGVKKALVFYSGKAPKGVKTNWIMHEYRLAESVPKAGKRKGSLRMDDWVLCRIYKKSSSGQKAEKECSDDSSGLDEILDFLPEIEDNKLALNIPRLSSVKESCAEEQVTRPSKNFDEEAQNSGHSGCTEVRADGAAVTQFLLGDLGCGNSYRACEESSQGGASSLELSHMTNENLRQQHSPPDPVLEDDSVESTFSSLPAFCSADQVTGSFAHPFFSFDSLPSPLGRFEKFSDFGGEDFFNLEV